MGQAPHASRSCDPYVGVYRSDERETTMGARTWFFAATYDRFIRATERAGLHDMRDGPATLGATFCARLGVRDRRWCWWPHLLRRARVELVDGTRCL
jgi:hypothetical protein